MHEGMSDGMSEGMNEAKSEGIHTQTVSDEASARPQTRTHTQILSRSQTHTRTPHTIANLPSHSAGRGEADELGGRLVRHRRDVVTAVRGRKAVDVARRHV